MNATKFKQGRQLSDPENAQIARTIIVDSSKVSAYKVRKKAND